VNTRLLALTLFALTAIPVPAPAQTSVVRIGVLQGPSITEPVWRAFSEALSERGWVEGRNLEFHRRSANGRVEQYPVLAAELVALAPDIIVTDGTQPTQAVREKTKSIPIVMVGTGDPVGSGFAVSLARPGGNITGISYQLIDTAGKALQLLTEAQPGITRVAQLWVPDNSASKALNEALGAAAPRLGVAVERASVRTSEDLAGAFTAIAQSQPQALFTGSAPLLLQHRGEIIAFARERRLPSIGMLTLWARDGALLSYAADTTDIWRRSADYVDRILRGAKPGDLPVEQPTKFNLVINRKTAHAIGLDISPSLLARADEVIE
jgi:putative ABC transport system substrate-binding protein